MSFREFAFLFLPADDPEAGSIVEAGDEWWFDPPGGRNEGPMIWGRGPLSSGERAGRMLAFAIARARAIARLRRGMGRGFGFDAVVPHRLPPPRLSGGPLRNAIRSTLLQGALVELRSRGSGPRVVDASVAAAGLEGNVGAMHPGSGGGALIRIARPDRLFRVAREGGPGDPSHAADGLERVARTSTAVVTR